MKRKQLWRVLGTGCLAVSLLASPMTGLSALAADEGTTGVTPIAGKAEGLNPLQKAKDAVGTEGQEGYQPAVEGNDSVEIPVYGFTEDSTVYSVDVEWGAMTFRYENSTWDPETLTSKPGAGWQVYDSVADEAVVAADGTAVTEHTINEIKVTNHSNAGVWATLSYAPGGNYTDTTGEFSFTNGTETGDSDVLTAESGGVPAYLTLATANNGTGGAAGTPTVGKAYFMPDGIKEEYKKDDGISKWTEIGKITVGIEMEDPAPPAGP